VQSVAAGVGVAASQLTHSDAHRFSEFPNRSKKVRVPFLAPAATIHSVNVHQFNAKNTTKFRTGSGSQANGKTSIGNGRRLSIWVELQDFN
jgi:hypothetical protein